jgi:hypothetical protein
MLMVQRHAVVHDAHTILGHSSNHRRSHGITGPDVRDHRRTGAGELDIACDQEASSTTTKSQKSDLRQKLAPMPTVSFFIHSGRPNAGA